MQDVLDWGIGVVLWLQHYSPALDPLFILLSVTGSELFFLLLLPMIAWCISPRVGVRLMVLVLLSTYLNAIAKILFAQPRPFDYDPRVLKIEQAAGGGLPSGHTQSTVVFWGYLARYYNRKWLWRLAFALILLVPLSRVYLGVHFPTDLLGGYFFGFVVLMLFTKYEQWFINKFDQADLVWQLLLALVIPISLILIAPEIDQVIVSIVGVLTGSFVGIVLEKKFVSVQVPKTMWKKTIGYGLGIIVLLVIYVGLKQLFDGLEPSLVYRYIRYILVGFHFTFFAPWLFAKLKLA